jgi:hypothetical protein
MTRGKKTRKVADAPKYEDKLPADSNDKTSENYVQGFRRHQEDRRFCEDSKGSNKFY